jgi:RNA polymerase-associated protein
VITLYDADRCPYCARVRVVLAEKNVPYETVQVDLGNKPAWLLEKNPLGRVPVLEEDGLCLPESAVIMELLEERYPEPALLPVEPAERALARLAVWRFDTEFSDAYYAARRGGEEELSRFEERVAALDARLAERPYLTGSEYGLADIAWFPWLPRAERYLDVSLDDRLNVTAWLKRLAARPAVAAELDLVAAMPV